MASDSDTHLSLSRPYFNVMELRNLSSAVGRPYFNVVEHMVYQACTEAAPSPRFIPCSVKIEATLTFRVHTKRHYCSTGQVMDLIDLFWAQETLDFDLQVLKNRDQVYQLVDPVLRRMYVDPDLFNKIIDDMIRKGLRIAKLKSNRGRRVLALHADMRGEFVEHVNDEEQLRASLRRSREDEFGSSSYNMVPAKDSSVKNMLKRVRVDQEGAQNTKKGRVETQDCVICLEQLKVGSTVSQMPCSHAFHGDCIQLWLTQSHYCPVCRFEMPT